MPIDMVAENSKRQRIEDYINKEMEAEKKKERVFTYSAIANSLDINEAELRKIFSLLDAGGTGITVSKESSCLD